MIALPYVVVGWAAVVVLPAARTGRSGPTGFVLLLLGGLAYSAGAVVYALKKPNPVPGVFGYHEVFHACTIVGAVLHFIVIAGSCCRWPADATGVTRAGGDRRHGAYHRPMALTVYGVLALTFMMSMYALERRGNGYVLAFAVGCALSSAYGFASGAWPFGVVEGDLDGDRRHGAGGAGAHPAPAG